MTGSRAQFRRHFHKIEADISMVAMIVAGVLAIPD
jgi:hypothetical protein